MHFIILLDIDNDSVTLFILADQQKKKKNSRQDLAGGPLVANTCCRGI